MSETSPAQMLPPPPGQHFSWTGLFKFRSVTPRWTDAARVAFCTGVPVAVGWAMGDMSSGLLATLGSLTSLYAPDRPYRSKAPLLAAIALSFAVVICLGILAQPVGVLAILVIVLIAMVSTYLCNVLRIGPPGAYIFTLACATGTAMPVTHLDIYRIGLTVLAGGAFAWVAQMAGALVAPRAPERRVVIAAAAAVARFADAVGTPQEDIARHEAAATLNLAWTTLITFQPTGAPGQELSELRALNRSLHLLFVGVVNSARQGNALDSLADEARRIGAQIASRQQATTSIYRYQLPLGHPRSWQAIREGFSLDSPALWATFRVGVAALVAGIIGATLELERTYWAVSVAVLILNQGMDWNQTLQRGLERMIGTLIGLSLAALFLVADIQGLWLAVLLTALQFTIQMLVSRNYAVAAIFITAAALTISGGGRPVPNLEHLLWVRGTDTIIGCVIGLIVYRLVAMGRMTPSVPQQIINTLSALDMVLTFVAAGAVTSKQARSARNELQRKAFALLQSYQQDAEPASVHRDKAEERWPSVIATERLVYRVLAMCWSLEGAGSAAPRMAKTLLSETGAIAVKQALSEIMTAVREETKAILPAELPSSLSDDLDYLSRSLVNPSRT